MKKIVIIFAAASVLLACTQKEYSSWNSPYRGDESFSHDEIVLGEQLDDPYSVRNMTKALQNIAPSARTTIEPTDFYVRFLPKDDEQLQILLDMGLELTDHPLDYRIVRDGDWYHDPMLPEESITWQYAVVPVDFEFPAGVRYERIDECFLADNNPSTKSDGIDWEAVEREAFRITGNADLYPGGTKASESFYPKGRITISDPAVDDEPIGVKGVKICCNSFVKFSVTYTDDEGYFKMGLKFSSKVRYWIVFQNINGFKQGINRIIIPASVSTLGVHPAEGCDILIDSYSERKLFTRCVVNNAGFDYCTACNDSGRSIPLPPKDLRIWDIPVLNLNFAVMMHQGTILETYEPLSSVLGEYTPIAKLVQPDIYLGLLDTNGYSDIYERAMLAFAKAGMFSQVGKKWWTTLVEYSCMSLISSGLASPYGARDDENSGYCEVAQMYASYCQTVMFRRRYTDSSVVFGTSSWFSPQILLYLDERGLGLEKLAPVFTADVVNLEGLQNKLLSYYPAFKSVINEAFARYGE
ncbi:MAG: hypothetical protein K6E37_06660 [Bacteroidales bacterium]|nr:hypothetical protein [Bacteroidales bacterium]